MSTREKPSNDDSPEPTVTARPSKRGLRRADRIIIAMLVVFLVGALSGVAWLYHTTFGKIETIQASTVFEDYADRPQAATAKPGQEAPLNILLLGSDTRASDETLLDSVGARADAILVVHISGDRQHIEIVSIMRDMWVEVPGYGMNKINAAMSYGGTALLTRTVEGLINTRIDHVALVDFQGFKEMTNALGGVTLDNPIAFSTTPSPEFPQVYQFKQGTITVSGDAALAYVRERYAFPDNDFQRVRNQQAFLKGLLTGMRDHANPGQLSSLTAFAQSLSQHIAIDDSFTLAQATELASTLSSLEASALVSLTFPVSGSGVVDGQSVVFIDEAKADALAQAFASDALSSYER
ncbi:LCP family protein [Schaalia suimastitidis]|uniref:LCP family protein n=1 Tax=Schaalia suimastitidis TaxID=121163 RepID=UPI000407B1C9|nr:LCP family protein [Schaalia suimastitidis]